MGGTILLEVTMSTTATNLQNHSVFATDRRSAERVDVVIWARVGLSDDSEYPARITNISTAGLMAMTPCPAAEDVGVRIKLPEIGWIECNVAWRMDDRIGLSFDRALSEEEFFLLNPYRL